MVALDPPQVAVAAPDRRGLLASVAGVLALHGLDVRSADATGDDGVAVEVFTVEVRRGPWPDSARLREDLRGRCSPSRLALDDRLADEGPRLRRRAAAPARPARSPPRSRSTTRPRPPPPWSRCGRLDELGLLHRVTRALFDCDLDVVSARVSTIGDDVVDAFYVRDADGQKVTDPGRPDRSTAAVRRRRRLTAVPF